MPRWEKTEFLVKGTNRGKIKEARLSGIAPRKTENSPAVASGPGLFLTPLLDEHTGTVKSYLVGKKHNDSSYSYKLYNRDSLNQILPRSEAEENDLLTAQAVFGHFEKSINGKTEIVTTGGRPKKMRNASVALQFEGANDAGAIGTGSSISGIETYYCEVTITVVAVFEVVDFYYNYGPEVYRMVALPFL